MASAPAIDDTVSTSGFPEVEFGQTADGLLAARLGEHAFAMAPARDGRHYLATGWRIRRPIREWTRSDFYGHSGGLADEAAFRSKVLEQAEHHREQLALGRREEWSEAHTPWGPSQGTTIYADGVVFYSTDSHGGFHLSSDRNRAVHATLRVRGGYYEEDEAWAIVAFSFPHLFTTFERGCAEKSIKDSYPVAWETITGTVLSPGDSRKKDELAFFERHAADWIVASTICSDQHPGFTEVIATQGGRRGHDVERRRFLIPSDAYRMDRFGFVIDTNRYEPFAGPSSFASWQPGALS
ncbi:MAG: hypothetical protein ABI414_14785 [Devosia sp.]